MPEESSRGSHGDQTQASIGQIIEVLREWVIRLDEIRSAMQRKKIDRVAVRHWKSLDRTYEDWDRWAASLEKAVRRAIIAGGNDGNDSTPSTPKNSANDAEQSPSTQNRKRRKTPGKREKS